MMYGDGRPPSRKARVMNYYSMLIMSPGLMKIRDDAASDVKTVGDFSKACLAAALLIDAEFERIGAEENA
jgi:hypothetical protein